ncbi:MAG: hypothetical protein PHF00_13565, partial [Elusimicrobia bacterium]|nr:hypothetical protein [Elusimicrobiota bacterium]
LFGLSLQFHPIDPAEEALQQFILAAGRGRRPPRRPARLRRAGPDTPKSEAWLPLRHDGALRLAEIQQSSDSTFSVADFFTPFTWDKGPRFRKGHPALGLSDGLLRRMVGSLDFSVTRLESIRCRPQAAEPGPDSCRCRLWKLLDRPALWPYFTVERLDLAGGPDRPARWAAAAQEVFQQVVVLSGKVRLECGGKDCGLGVRSPAFIPAGAPGGFSLTARGPARLVLLSVPGPGAR